METPVIYASSSSTSRPGPAGLAAGSELLRQLGSNAGAVGVPHRQRAAFRAEKSSGALALVTELAAGAARLVVPVEAVAARLAGLPGGVSVQGRIEVRFPRVGGRRRSAPGRQLAVVQLDVSLRRAIQCRHGETGYADGAGRCGNAGAAGGAGDTHGAVGGRPCEDGELCRLR